MVLVIYWEMSLVRRRIRRLLARLGQNVFKLRKEGVVDMKMRDKIKKLYREHGELDEVWDKILSTIREELKQEILDKFGEWGDPVVGTDLIPFINEKLK